MPSKFVRAYNRNGVIQRIPRAWLAEDSPFAGDFTMTPSARQVEERSANPDETWTVRQLREYAGRVDLDLTGANTKADILGRISAGQGGGPVDSEE